MALVGKATKYSTVLKSEKSDIINNDGVIDINQNDDLYDLIAEDIGDVYVHLHSVNIWKDYADKSVEKRDLMNINYRVFKSKEDKIKDPESYIFEDDLLGQFIDFSSNNSVMDQAYELIRGVMGFEQLTND